MESVTTQRSSFKASRKPFVVDHRIHVRLDFDLAIRVGEIILKSAGKDGQALALGHQLVNLAGDSDDDED